MSYNDEESTYRYTREDLIRDGQESQDTKKTAYYTPYNEIDSETKKKKKETKPRKKNGVGKFVGKVVAAALIFGLVAGVTFNGTNYITTTFASEDTAASDGSSDGSSSDVSNAAYTVSTSSGDSTTTEVISATALDVSEVVESVMPSIVSITSISTVNYYGYEAESTSAGSGIIVAETDDYIYIATNNHVIDGASSITVTFIDESTATAEVKGTDADTDLAVLSVAIEDLSADTYSQIKVATLGDSDDLKVGETAIAIGNALGYGQSVTTGVISALNREVTIDNVTNELIQTDAAINPGNSGGALINAEGEVIGINSAKYSDTSVEGMGYAIPISTALPIIEELIEREVVEESKSAYLGVSGVDVTSDVAQMYNMPEGLYISKVISGTSAEDAGLQQGDIITAFDGHTISSMADLQNIIQYYEAGTTIDLTIQRMGNSGYEEITVSVTLGKKS